MLLKVSPSKGIKKFGQNGKLNPRFVSLSGTIEKIVEVAYFVALPPKQYT